MTIRHCFIYAFFASLLASTLAATPAHAIEPPSLPTVSVRWSSEAWILDDFGTSYRRTGTKWIHVRGGPFSDLDVGIDGEAWAIDQHGALHRFNGAAWVAQPGQTLDVISVGNEGHVWGLDAGVPFEWDGASFVPRPGRLLSDISVTPYGSVWGLTKPPQPHLRRDLVKLQGNQWVDMPLNGGPAFHPMTISALDHDTVIANSFFHALRYDGTWQIMPNSFEAVSGLPNLTTSRFASIDTGPGGAIWAIDHDGTTYRADGNQFEPVNAPTPTQILCEPTDWHLAWKDAGSGALDDVAFWRPAVGYSLGAVASRGYARPVAGACGYSSPDPTAFALPLGFERVWDDEGSGAHLDGTFLRANCPAGYETLGLAVAQTHNEPEQTPEVQQLRCIRSDLVEPTSWLPHQIWSNFGAFLGAEKVSVWGFTAHNSIPEVRGATLFRIDKSTLADPPPLTPKRIRQDVLATVTPMEPARLPSLIAKYAPVVHFHSDEQFFPSSVPDFLANSNEVLDANGNTGLELTANASRTGDLALATTYINTKVWPRTTDIQYWFFYPFNGHGIGYFEYLGAALGEGDQGLGAGTYELPPCGEHEGDWEHVTVRVDNASGQAVQIALSQHGNAQIFRGSDLDQVIANRWSATPTVEVYASRHGHALYAAPGRYHPAGVDLALFEFRTVDITDHGPEMYDAQNSLEWVDAHVMGSWGDVYHTAHTRPDWFSYKGRWGAVYSLDAPTAVDVLPQDTYDVLDAFGLIDDVDAGLQLLASQDEADECLTSAGPVPPFADWWTWRNGRK